MYSNIGKRPFVTSINFDKKIGAYCWKDHRPGARSLTYSVKTRYIL